MTRWLYIDTFTAPADEADPNPSSDSIGYGITTSAAIVAELQARGVEVVRVSPPIPTGTRDSRHIRARWIADVYRLIVDLVTQKRPDLIFIFHIFSVFPTVIRKCLQDLGADIPLAGYTHGSHWDPTDVYRAERHPQLKLLDLANMDTLDRLLVVSEYMRRTLSENIGALSPVLARAVMDKTSVVGLPLDVARIERQRTEERFDRTTIVFNHAPITSKQPKIFAQVAGELLDRHDVAIAFTRRFSDDQPGGKEIAHLAHCHPGRVLLGDDLPIDEYYRTLWRSHIQVSTASHESFGVATLEAMYTENCCVLPSVGAYPELCGGNPDVLYSPTGDDLVQRLGRLIESPCERQRISDDLARVARSHQAATVVDRILGSLPDLAAIPERRACHDRA